MNLPVSFFLGPQTSTHVSGNIFPQAIICFFVWGWGRETGHTKGDPIAQVLLSNRISEARVFCKLICKAVDIEF